MAEQIVNSLGICLATCRLHDLAHEPAQHGRFGQNSSNLVGILGNYLIHGLFNGAAVGHLFKAPAFDNFGGQAALGPDYLEDLLGDFP